MSHSEAKIHCSNPKCQALNLANHKFCQKCHSPLLKRYLWAIGEGIETYELGSLIAERYLIRQSRLVLDTQPSLMPDVPEEIPEHIAPYLKLSPYQLHIPQVYGQLTSSGVRKTKGMWLLEYGMLSGEMIQRLEQGKLLPKLSSIWHRQTNLRQLNWLWQISELWQPLEEQGVVSTLLQPSLLQVKNSIVHLQELQFDGSAVPDIAELGHLWWSWVKYSSPSLKILLKPICQQLIQGQIQSSEQLSNLLNQAIGVCQKGQTQSYQIYTSSETGPMRDHNEDACYPDSGQVVSVEGENYALSIVCDGIGGHEGGEVASQLAIKGMQAGVEYLAFDANDPQPEAIKDALADYVCNANDVISNQNDSEHRHERQRMGTTLVMTLAHAQEMYVTHVGDSRVYLITRHACHQITLDDDVASREVRLGYALYREAVQYPASGSLVQALGMSSSENLRPTVQRFVIDEDCVFLLCTDGLSDNDRVEQYWEAEILPILSGKTTINKTSQRLIEIANQKNGHDNVTVALVHCQVEYQGDSEQKTLPPPELEWEEEVEEQAQVRNSQSHSSKLAHFLSWVGLVVMVVLVGLSLDLFAQSDLYSKLVRQIREVLMPETVPEQQSSPTPDPTPPTLPDSDQKTDPTEVKPNDSDPRTITPNLSPPVENAPTQNDKAREHQTEEKPDSSGR